MKKLSILFFALILLLAACGGGEKASDSKSDGEVSFDDLFVTIATGGTSGVYYPLGGALATILEDKLGIDASVQATQASVENVNLILSDRAELALITGDTGFQAYEGSGPFEKEGAKEDLRALASFYPNYLQIIATKESGIKSFADLKGKKVAVGAPNSGTELAAQVLLEGHGMSYKDITPDYLSFAEAAEQMKNGIIDAAILSSGIPNSAIMDLETTHGVNFLPIEDDAMKYLTEKYSYLKEATIPAGSYSNKEDVAAISITNALIVSKDLSDDEVYAITKAIFENLDTLKNAHSAAEDIDVNHAPDGLGIPLHPGAEKYFKEEGVLK
ncbi:TAXI family TRAP transporter solute-binding subunit [Siminovitchia acidinfaciens]|uniref:TAXI family TRAP transporter solute-binding subunit n=1 Tax=Siminovitchia acidinfaciens TaxID=2321395 RepID=A0A429XU49_9BACI|nr:TAXI family TRAP transporter solute-binding subunit [Siminovitchia acidinfaciens]RST71522.1 TAXI family TRAP transporter solute-binding subunit [Siminovitchia acidinfaciens]